MTDAEMERVREAALERVRVAAARMREADAEVARAEAEVAEAFRGVSEVGPDDVRRLAEMTGLSEAKIRSEIRNLTDTIVL